VYTFVILNLPKLIEKVCCKKVLLHWSLALVLNIEIQIPSQLKLMAYPNKGPALLDHKIVSDKASQTNRF
jgi:hypothetical protein